MNSVKLFWWRPKEGGVNIGDEISRILFDRLFQVQVDRAPYASANMNSTGSTLGWAFGRDDIDARTEKMVILGSGLMHPWHEIEDEGWLDIRLVRGYFTRSVISKAFGESMAIGDPGLLASDLLPPELPEKKFKYGIIPHISRAGKKHFHKRFEKLPSKTFINVKTDDIDEFLGKMLECEVIISQSLHGLIFADSIGLPNVWLDAGRLHPGGSFKFYDYFSSINRPFDLKFSLAEFDVDERSMENAIFYPDQNALDPIKQAIRNTMESTFRELTQ